MSESPTCPKCGKPLTGATVQGLCAHCLGAFQFAADTVLTGQPGVTPAEPLPLAEVAGYFPQLEILEYLGRGGMGVVYKARQKSLNRTVALKLLAPERVNDERFAARFSREARALAALSHPGIVTVYDFGQTGGFYYLLMEFVDGVNLRQAMHGERLKPEEALAIVPPICEALQYAHEHGIVHRDIKPENLLLDTSGRVKIADFGVAKILNDEDGASIGLAETQPAGTPQYMAPEQKAQGSTDHRADIYSLGVVLYEMLTGELPGERLDPPSRRVQVSVRIDEIVLRALEQQPELRYPSAADFRTQVEAAVPHAVVPPPAPGGPRGSPLVLVLAAMLVLLVIAVPASGIAIHQLRDWGAPLFPSGWPLVVSLLAGVGVGIAGIVLAIRHRNRGARLGLAILGSTLVSALAAAVIVRSMWLRVPMGTPPSVVAEAPHSINVTRDGGTVLVHYMDSTVHHVLYAPRGANTAVGDSRNYQSLLWQETGSVRLLQGERSFSYLRQSVSPQLLNVSGQEFDLRRGEVIVLHEDGQAEQIRFFPILEEASDPREVAALVQRVRDTYTEPPTPEKLQERLRIAEAQLKRLLNTHAPEHPLAEQFRREIEDLKRQIEVGRKP